MRETKLGILFISHSSKNNEEAIELRDWLLTAGYSQTFLDLDPEQGLAPGQRWEDELQRAGERCSGIVVLISPEWAESKWCFHEFKFAKALGKKIFPVLIKPTSVEELPRELHSHYQLADISSPELKQDGLTRLRIGLRRAGLDPKHFPWPPENEPDRAPYRGLQALTEKDAAVFFGRDAQITSGLDKLRQMRWGAPRRILTVAAASGAGKSSFLKAGLLARLKRDTQNFIVLPTVRPGRDALAGATGVLNSFGIASSSASDLNLSHALGALQAPVIEHLTSLAVAAKESYDLPPPTLVLPIDQAEELFSVDNATGSATIDLLKRSLTQKLDLVFILTIRSDSLGLLQADSDIASQLELFNLPALQPVAFKEVIEGPASLTKPSIKIESALTLKLIEDLDRSDALPLLAFTLERLVEEYGDDHLLELSDYEDGLGGIAGAINAAVGIAFANAIKDPELPDGLFELETLAKTAFIPSLVQLEEADASPKRRVAKLETDIPENARQLLRHFADERLVVIKQAAQSEPVTVEVSHEAVLRHWLALDEWISEERVVLVGMSRVIQSAKEWGGNGKTPAAYSPDLLVHRGERLAAAEALFDRDDFAKHLDGQPTNYLKACRALENKAQADAIAQAQREASQEARGRFWRRLTTAMVFTAAVLTGWGLFTTIQGQRAVQQNFATFLNIEANSAIDEGHFDRAMRLAILASADSALSPADKGANFALGRSLKKNVALIALVGATAEVRCAAFSPDGSRIVTGSDDNAVRVWTQEDDGGWESEVLTGHADRIQSAAFSPDGSQVLTASDDNTARIWTQDDDGGWHSKALEGHFGAVLSGAFSHDGSQIVTGSLDHTSRVWTQGDNGGWHSELLAGHSGSIFAAAFSPDGSQVLTASDDNTARIWTQDDDGGWQSEALEGHSNSVLSAAFSPDGSKVVTASYDDTTRVWVQNNNGDWQGVPLEGHSFWVQSAEFSPDGSQIVTASFDQTARVWTQGDDGAWQSEVLEGHTNTVLSAAFSPDGSQIVTASSDGTARIWTRSRDGSWQSEPLAGHSGSVLSVAFSLDDGSQIVTASSDRTVRVWARKNDGGWRSEPLEGHSNSVLSAAFSPDGTQIVTASYDNTTRLWMQNHEGSWQSAPLIGHSHYVQSAAFSPDGSRIVTASSDDTARIWKWSKRDGWQSEPLEGHSNSVLSAAFSPDGTQIVTASSDETARIWTRGDDGRWQSEALEGHSNSVRSAAFSPYGTQIVTASSDETARIWTRGDDGRWQSEALEGHSNSVRSAAFSPDGTQIVTASSDETARVWTQGDDGGWHSEPLEGHSSSVQSAAFSPDGSQIVTASSDRTARIWNIGGLLSDASRVFAASKNSEFQFTPIKDEACGMLFGNYLVEKNSEVGQDGRRYPLAEITEDDIGSVPVLASMGLKPGDNVCKVSRSGPIDSLLSFIVPIRFWSGLDYQ